MIRDLAIITTVGLCWSAAVIIAIWRHNTREGQRQDRQAHNIERHNRERAGRARSPLCTDIRNYEPPQDTFQTALFEMYEITNDEYPWMTTALDIAGRLEGGGE